MEIQQPDSSAFALEGDASGVGGQRSRSASIGRSDRTSGHKHCANHNTTEPAETSAAFVGTQIHPKTHTHRLVIRQQPLHSRMCGFGEKVDRRPVDPPPIIQLDITSNGTPEDFAYLYNPYYFMYASLIALDNEDEVHILHDGKTRSTTGSIVSSLYRLRDLDNKDGAFFVFPDLSVRMEGSYRLKFSLFEIINTEMYYCTSIISNPFNVYSAKKFPGMEESTFLSKAFAEQGLKIRIRKELRVRKEGGFVNVAPLSDFAANEQPRQKRSSIEGNQDGNDHDDSAGSASEEHITKRVKERLSSTEANSNKLAIGILGQAVPGYPYLAPAAQPPMLMVPTHYQQQQAQQMARQQAQQHAKHQAHQAQQQVHIQSQQQAQHQAQKVQQQQQQHQHHHQHTPKQQQHTEQQHLGHFQQQQHTEQQHLGHFQQGQPQPQQQSGPRPLSYQVAGPYGPAGYPAYPLGSVPYHPAYGSGGPMMARPMTTPHASGPPLPHQPGYAPAPVGSQELYTPANPQHSGAYPSLGSYGYYCPDPQFATYSPPLEGYYDAPVGLSQPRASPRPIMYPSENGAYPPMQPQKQHPAQPMANGDDPNAPVVGPGYPAQPPQGMYAGMVRVDYRRPLPQGGPWGYPIPSGPMGYPHLGMSGQPEFYLSQSMMQQQEHSEMDPSYLSTHPSSAYGQQQPPPFDRGHSEQQTILRMDVPLHDIHVHPHLQQQRHDQQIPPSPRKSAVAHLLPSLNTAIQNARTDGYPALQVRQAQWMVGVAPKGMPQSGPPEQN